MEKIKDFENNPEKVKAFYDSIKGISLDKLKNIFPSPHAKVEQENFDAVSKILFSETIEDIALTSMSVFRHSHIEKISDENFKQDMRFLQGVFFFFLQDLCSKNNLTDSAETEKLFCDAIKENTWYTAKTQADILNTLSAKLGFLRENPFDEFDFTEFKGNYFEANESILRLISNFATNQEALPKEKLINEMNFVREQQKKVLQIWPNTKRVDYSDSDAEKEIQTALKNLEALKQIDFGFEDKKFTQIFFADDKRLSNSFTRPITCKFFAESEMNWKKGDPLKKSNRYGSFKIVARKDDRYTNRSALKNKFLYPERNMVTHVSGNFALYSLFEKEYNESQESYWERLVLYAFFDSREYLVSLLNEGDESQKANAKNLLKILNHYFRKITDNLKVSAASDEELWKKFFDESGNIKVKHLNKTNVYTVFANDEDKIEHLSRFISFLYCTGNEEEDFFEKNSFKIQIYLIYLTFKFARLENKI